MDKERIEQILNNLLGYVSEHCCDEADEYRAFRNIIGLSIGEMIDLGLEFEKDYETLEFELNEEEEI